MLLPANALLLSLLTTLSPGAAQEPAQEPARFPASTALAEGVSPNALGGLSQLVQSFVDDEEIVGAELLVVVNGHSILHQAYGWSDREAERPMETGSVFCVRSMTKPVIGTAILMLVDDDVLELDDRVAQYLPSFDVPGQRDITVEHLLTHTSGLPMSLLLGKDLHALDGIRAVAALGGEVALDFAPGSAFQYSDQGTDTLTALIEVASGMPAAEFVRTRVLEPLGMRDSATVMTKDDPLRARALVKYVGSRGDWSRFWGPDEEPLFPFFLGSQGLYSTLGDYARFLEFWVRRGRVGREKLLGSRYVRKALEPGPHPMHGGSGLPGLAAEYGFLMQLWLRAREQEGGGVEVKAEAPELVAFGHTGSDGTYAWAFPEQNALVLYFTQSRNNQTGLRVEEALGELFLGVPYDANQDAPPFEQYLGYYREDEQDLYRAIVLDGDELALEVMGRAVVALTYVGDDRWKIRSEPSTVLAFERDESGAVTGYHIGEHREFRFEPSADLPSVDELAQRVAETYRLDLLESLGPMRITSAVTIEKAGLEGEATSVLTWPDRFAFSSRIVGPGGEETESVTYDGEHVRYASSSQPAATLDGPRAEALRTDCDLVRFGDWRRWYPHLEVIQALDWGDGIVVVRAGDTSAPACTMYVQPEQGLVAREDNFVFVERMGRVGRRLTFGDWREVSGMRLPYRTEIEIAANPLIGTIVATITDVDVPNPLQTTTPPKLP